MGFVSARENMGNGNSKEWIIRVLLVLMSLSIGFGVSQLAVAGQVRENTTKIDSIESTLERMERKLDKALGLE